jgi:hypothetical protein
VNSLNETINQSINQSIAGSLSPVSYMVSENNLDNVDVFAVDWLEDFTDIEGLCSSFKSSESDWENSNL